MKALLIPLITGLVATSATTASASPALRWEDCHGDLRCASLRVPADWTRPSPPLSIPVIKLPAREDRLGTLVVNPGGPAASVRNFALPGYRDQFADLAARFDVVVVDPRGLDVTCPTANPPALPAPLAEDAHAAYAEANARLAASCPPPGPLDARQVARDLDALRKALGERRLNYFGNSYGTVYGQAYAELFGHRVGRMYLDSVFDHTNPDPADWVRPGAVTAERNLRRMAAWCAADPSCALHGQDVLAVWDRLSADPTVLNWVAARIGNDRSWPAIATGLAQGVTPGPAPADFRLARTALCQDFAFPDDFRSLKRVEDDLRATTPRIGWAVQPWRVSGHCSGLPRTAANPPAALKAEALPPVLVANGENDPLTPAAHGRRVAAQLRATYLPTAGNHGLYLRGNACVRDHVHRYLWTGALPHQDARC